MTTNQELFFTCPHYGERFAQVEEPDKDIHTGDCYFCQPEPSRFGPNTDATDNREKGETT